LLSTGLFQEWIRT